MILYHGTNKEITDGLATGTFFSNKRDIAEFYGKRAALSAGSESSAVNIYSVDVASQSLPALFSQDIFGEHFISRCFMPINALKKNNDSIPKDGTDCKYPEFLNCKNCPDVDGCTSSAKVAWGNEGPDDETRRNAGALAGILWTGRIGGGYFDRKRTRSQRYRRHYKG